MQSPARVLVVYNPTDVNVPVAHTRLDVELARVAGEAVDYRELDGADHSVLIHERSPEWAGIGAEIVARLTGR